LLFSKEFLPLIYGIQPKYFIKETSFIQHFLSLAENTVISEITFQYLKLLQSLRKKERRE